MTKTYFFCGVGGSGMMPLAKIILSSGHKVHGSDRSYDQGATPDKFQALQDAGITLHPQDGSGLNSDIDVLVTSTAVEPTIPDVKAALDKGIPILCRAELLASLFNASKTGISIAGTSGKSTVTGMVTAILQGTGHAPIVMNGGVMRGFDSKCERKGERKGESKSDSGSDDIFLTETDESDGSIKLYNPSIAVVNNIALDHMPIEDITALFTAFIARATKGVVLNGDDPILRELDGLKFSMDDVSDVSYSPQGSSFTWQDHQVTLNVPGAHNIANALAALSVAQIMEIDLVDATKALCNFKGIGRRLELIGTSKNNITIIDDFAHNPDKIAASLKSLREFDGRLLVIFQPHGFGPLKLMGKEIIESFAENMGQGDQLLMPEVFYAGGTADKFVTSKDVIKWAKNCGIEALWFETRADILPYLKDEAKSGDRIIIMGARDDSLTEFANDVLDQVA